MGWKLNLFVKSQKGRNVLRKKERADVERKHNTKELEGEHLEVEDRIVLGPSNATESLPLGLIEVDVRTSTSESQSHINASNETNARNTPIEIRAPRKPLFPDDPSNLNISDLSTTAQRMIAGLPTEIWHEIVEYLSPADTARLALSNKTLRCRLGSQAWRDLDLPENKDHKILVLSPFDHHLPGHLFCFLCARYHRRLQPGVEKLQANHVLSPVFNCPNAQNLSLPRARLVHSRDLPFASIQLAARAHQYSEDHGIPLSNISRRWKCKDSTWSHSTRFHFHHNGHLFMRCSSTCPAEANLTPNQVRLLLFSRSDYAPYFSVCQHWSNGDLIKICKCALSHVPAPEQSLIKQFRQGPKVDFKKTRIDIMPKQCDECKPLRRCPECPTEYLVQLKIVEDPNDRQSPFKQAMCVTRWSDLGDGSSPYSPEWAACIGQTEFDSGAALGGATITSLFEQAVSNGAPGQRVLWLNKYRRRAHGIDDVY